MKPTSEVHAETVALVSDAVAAITERAVRPTLAPFQQELRKLTTGLDQKINEIDDLLRDDRDDREKLLEKIGRVGGDLSTRVDAVVDSNRGWRDEAHRLGEHLAGLQQSMRDLEETYVQSDRNRSEEANHLAEHLAALTQGVQRLEAAQTHGVRELESALIQHTAAGTRQLSRMRNLMIRGLAAAGGLALLSAALSLVLLLS